MNPSFHVLIITNLSPFYYLKYSFNRRYISREYGLSKTLLKTIPRDFNHEEKGEEIDDLEPKMEEQEKVTKPRGWNKESVGKDDQQKPKKENPKKKKSQNLEKNEKSSGKNPKLPTADGSRQSRLDKENAEKEVANKNVWAERMSKQKKDDSDNDVSKNINSVLP